MRENGLKPAEEEVHPHDQLGPRTGGVEKYPRPAVLRREAGGETGIGHHLSATSGNRVYLTMILGFFDRKVIVRALSDDMETVLGAIPATHMTFTYRKTRDTPLFHSDRGAVLREILS
jgi:transposase InsO family protein